MNTPKYQVQHNDTTITRKAGKDYKTLYVIEWDVANGKRRIAHSFSNKDLTENSLLSSAGMRVDNFRTTYNGKLAGMEKVAATKLFNEWKAQANIVITKYSL